MVYDSSYAAEEKITTKKFPDDFMLGTATAAIQIEVKYNIAMKKYFSNFVPNVRMQEMK